MTKHRADEDIQHQSRSDCRACAAPLAGFFELGGDAGHRCEANGVATFRAEPFTVRVSDEVLADLRARIRSTRWPGPAPGAPWQQGTDLGYLRDLLAYWGGRLRLARAGTLAERVRSLPGRDRW